MAKVTLIIGLPGSGKTTLLERMKRQEEFSDYIFIDDPTVEDFPKIRDAILAQRNLVIADPQLCIESNLKSSIRTFEMCEYEITKIFFENCTKKCLTNIKHRDDDRIINSLEAFSYTIPSDVEPLPIWQP